MIRYFVFIWYLLFDAPAVGAQQFRLLEPREVAIDVYQNETVHDSYLSPLDRELNYGGNFHTNLNLLRLGAYRLFMNNRLHFDQSGQSGHIKHAGWEYDLGMDFKLKDGGCIGLGRMHHSRHCVECLRDSHFPVYDKTYIRFSIFC